MNSQERITHQFRDKEQIWKKDDEFDHNQVIFEAPFENHREMSGRIIGLELSWRYRLEMFGKFIFI